MNSYDRAAFTFGVYQFAAHTPGANLVLLFRKLLGLPDASAYFPDLALRPNSRGEHTVHRQDGAGGWRDLEIARNVTRPNGRVEKQIPDFMAYLNSDPGGVDAEELTATARLMLWCMNNTEARHAQLQLARSIAEEKLERARRKLPALAGQQDWRVYLWINDILHQGRGTFTAIGTALGSGDPVAALATIGDPQYATRIKTVRRAIDKIDQSGALNGWVP